MNEDQSARIVAEALTWLGTPYCHQGALKGIGCDCLGLIRGVWRAVIGAEPETLPPYTPDWAEVSRQDAMIEAARRHLIEVAADAMRPGDILLFRWRPHLPAKHAAILIAPHRFIHAHAGAVVATAPLKGWWRAHLAAVFRFPSSKA